MATVDETSSLGFDVRLQRVDMTSSEGDLGSVLSGSSEGFVSAQATPTVSIRKGYSDADDNHSVSAVSADSASFHTPEPYEMSSQDEEDVDLSVEIPDFEALPTNTYGIETTVTPTNVSIPELPKLALAEGVRGGVAEKGPLDKEYTDHRESRQLVSNGATNERTPLLHSNTDTENNSCCVLL
ncbi:uncharacterized protein LOC135347127 isoform X2 [Halichondria panicea]|uniref:uncharacterized protein LOC135347127 isoform X2 n=1 Tax=Halichondria panicea TaxID=6063 RepID=UPI00312BBA8F